MSDSLESWGAKLLINYTDGGEASYCCYECWKKTTTSMLQARMILCPECGNKRCPKATNHNNECTGSNEPGQPGSIY